MWWVKVTLRTYRGVALILLVGLLAASAHAASWEQVQTTSTGWTFSGTPLTACRAVGVGIETYGLNGTIFSSNYGSSNSTWATRQSNRAKGIGFNVNTNAEDYIYPANVPVGGIPAMSYNQTDFHAEAGDSGYGVVGNVKDILASAGSSQICNLSSGSGGSTANTEDYWEASSTASENAQTFLNSCIGNTNCSAVLANGGSSTLENTVWLLSLTEQDNIYGFNNYNHADGGYYILSNIPSVANNSAINYKHGISYTYVDKTLYIKLRAADILTTEYECSGNNTTWSGTAAACCTTAGLPANWWAGGAALCSPFPGTAFAGGSNPFGDSYIGATPAADALSNATHGLNHAWTLTGSTPCTVTPSHACNGAYTDWAQNDANLSDLSGGSYTTECSSGTCYGVGTTFLDENGKRVGEATLASNCTDLEGQSSNWARTPQIETDAHELISDEAARYVVVQETALSANGLTPSTRPVLAMGTYIPPSYVLTAQAATLNRLGDHNTLFWLSENGTTANGSGIWSSSQTTSLLQADIAAIQAGYSSDYPIEYDQFWDSQGITGSASDNSLGAAAPSQSIGFDDNVVRGTTWISLWENLLSQKDSNGKYPIIGLSHEYNYDQYAGPPAGGFGVWDQLDNLYDGCASTNTSWAANCSGTTYTGGTACGCKDANGNYLGAQLAYGATCSTGGSTPLMTTGEDTTATFGACTFRNEGTIQPAAETSGFTGASGHANQFGNNSAGGVVTPIQNWLAGSSWTDLNGVVRTGFCDPSVAPPNGTGGAGVGMW